MPEDSYADLADWVLRISLDRILSERAIDVKVMNVALCQAAAVQSDRYPETVKRAIAGKALNVAIHQAAAMAYCTCQ